MSIRSRRSVIAGAVLGVVGVVAIVVAIVGRSESSTPAQASLLFTVSGEAATMTPVAGSADGYRLVVTDADPSVVWFTDRPVRQSGVATLDWFAAQWDSGEQFAVDPPNAAIVLHSAVGSTDTVVVEMLTLSVDAATRAFTADVRVLSRTSADELTGNLAFHGDRHDPAGIPPRLGAVTLFIDPEVGMITVGGNGGSAGWFGNGGAGGTGAAPN